MANPTARPDLEPIFNAMNGYQATMALKGAIELGIFTQIDEGAATVDEIARRTGASPKGVRVVCDFLAIQGHLLKQNGQYKLPLNSKVFLSRNSPAYVGDAVRFLNHPWTIRNFTDMAAIIKRGGAVMDNAVAEEALWVEFARAMTGITGGIAHAAAPVLARGGAARKVLDISAGHGLFGITVAQAMPEAQVTGLDTPAVLEVARENAAKMGVGDRYHLLPGSAFDVDLGTGYDLVLVPNFIHHFNPETNIGLFKKIHAAMVAGGRLAVIEFVPNEDRISPPAAAAFSLMMLGAVPDGDAYTFAEIRDMVTAAGFKNPVLEELPPTPERLVSAAA
jgi:ubiquinone/menaquinone biosynthesis C-methylase UbiE